MAADAILWATTHYRREWYVGGSTVVAIIGNKIFPGIGDWYLARKGYTSQQYDGLVDKDRPNNLYEPVQGNFGVHGDFDHLASNRSFQFLINRNKKLFYIGFALFLGLLCWLIFG